MERKSGEPVPQLRPTDFVGGSPAPGVGQEGSLPPVTARRGPYLVVLRGARRSTEFMLRERLMTIGRGSEADIQIDEPSASRRHAAIERTPEGFVLRDLGSTNGTYHGGLLHGRETPLRQGDCFRIGDTEFLFQDDGEIP